MADQPRYAFFKGEIVPIEDAKISVMTHAFNYGTAVFGGLRAYWNADHEQLYIFRPIEHLVRLRNSASLMRMSVPQTAEDLRDILLELLRHENYRQNVYIRRWCTKQMKKSGCACTMWVTT